MGLCELYKLGLFAKAVDGTVPAAGYVVLAGQERVVVREL